MQKSGRLGDITIPGFVRVGLKPGMGNEEMRSEEMGKQRNEQMT